MFYPLLNADVRTVEPSTNVDRIETYWNDSAQSQLSLFSSSSFSFNHSYLNPTRKAISIEVFRSINVSLVSFFSGGA
jgi:hypothetical protein